MKLPLLDTATSKTACQAIQSNPFPATALSTSPDRSDFPGQIPVNTVAMTRFTVVRKSFNPLLRQTWVYCWYKLRAYRYQLADRVNARSGWLARWIRWPLGVGKPHRWSEVHVFRFGGIGDSLMSTPALACSSRSGPRFGSYSILPTWRHSGACPFSTRFGSSRIILIPRRCGRSPSRAAWATSIS